MSRKQSLLLFMRHGETEYNKLSLIQGHADSLLTCRGVEAAKSVGQTHLATLPLTHVFCSDLGRAKHTCELALGGRHPQPVFESALRERDFGSWTGRHFGDLIKEAKQVGATYPEYSPDDAETLPALRLRAGEFLTRAIDLIEESPSAQVTALQHENLHAVALFVTHGGWLREALNFVHETWGPFDSAHSDHVLNRIVSNCSLTAVTLHNHSDDESRQAKLALYENKPPQECQ